MNTEALYRKTAWRLVPFLFLCYIAAFIDRINVGYAHLQMKETLGFSDAVYGLGASIFFVTYVIFEIPSNLLMAKVGIRKTLFRIMFLWGLASMATALVTSPWQFYAARLLLGAFEAGFFPAVMLYLSYWFPPARIGRITALFMTAVMFAGLIAGPVSGVILQQMESVAGLHGWQWLFILEGIPSLLLGCIALFFLSDRPRSASWLTTSESEYLDAQVGQNSAPSMPRSAMKQTLRDWRIYAWGVSLGLVICATYGVTFWLPQMIRAAGNLNYQQTGFFAAIPYVAGLVAMVLTAHHAERHQEFRCHFAAAAVVGAIGLGGTLLVPESLALSLLALSVANAGLASALPIFWPPVIAHSKSTHAPLAIAIITSLSVSGGALSPVMVGWAKTVMGDIRYGMAPLILLALLGAALYLLATARRSKVAPVIASGNLVTTVATTSL